MNKRKQALYYIVSDYFSAILAWTTFFVLRKKKLDVYFMLYSSESSFDENYLYGLIIIPVMWILFYYLHGFYKSIYRRSRLQELWQTFTMTLVGVLIIFFALLLDDNIYSYFTYYKSIAMLFSLHFVLTYLPRYILSSTTNRRIRNKILTFPTVMIGSTEKALKLYNKMIHAKKSSGNRFEGFLHVIEQDNYIMNNYMPHLGHVSDIHEVAKKYNIQEIIIAIDSQEHKYFEKVLYAIEGLDITIKALPDNCDIISGRVRTTSIHDEPLMEIRRTSMPAWQENAKRIIDVSMSVLFLTIFSPLYLALAIGVKQSSPGPIFYRQIRIGRYGKPFRIYKFRSMYIGAEKKGILLSTENDPRITPFGRFLRKTRLDEIPQFYNVLIGDMALVGPRPERKYFIEKILPVAPQVILLQRVRPGITSWGQVKFGYAQNIDEMVDRLQYDLMYIENMSLLLDFKILLYTIRTVILRQGI